MYITCSVSVYVYVWLNLQWGLQHKPHLNNNSLNKTLELQDLLLVFPQLQKGMIFKYHYSRSDPGISRTWFLHTRSRIFHFYTVSFNRAQSLKIYQKLWKWEFFTIDMKKKTIKQQNTILITQKNKIFKKYLRASRSRKSKSKMTNHDVNLCQSKPHGVWRQDVGQEKICGLAGRNRSYYLHSICSIYKKRGRKT